MKKETRKEEIIRVAAQLFKQKGYSAVTMRDLAKAMDMQAASLYNHINSKQAILQDIILEIAEAFTEGMNVVISESNSCVEKLNALIALHVRIATNNPEGLAALNTDWMHLEEKLDYYLQLRNDYENNFRAIIAEGIKNNELKSVDVEVILFSMLSTLRSLYLWIPKKDAIKRQQLLEDLTTVLIQGINK
jgi:AcrR family transcriptional regulator